MNKIKYSIGFLLILIGLAACDSTATVKERKEAENAHGAEVPTRISSFEYKDHVYIYFNSGSNAETVVHDPDCTCKK